MLLFPRAHHVSRCASHTVTRLVCRYRATSIPIGATAVLRQVGSERVGPFSSSGESAGGQEKATAATSTAAVTDGSADDAPKQVLLYEAGSKVSQEIRPCPLAGRLLPQS